MKCISVLLNNPNLGGKELKNKGELKDFATNLMGFANNDTKLDIVLSDVRSCCWFAQCIVFCTSCRTCLLVCSNTYSRFTIFHNSSDVYRRKAVGTCSSRKETIGDSTFAAQLQRKED